MTKEKVEELLVSAEKGDLEAQYRLANDYLEANYWIENPEDYNKQLEIYTKKGVSDEFLDSLFHSYWRFFKMNKIKALEYYNNAAERGHLKAQYYLSQHYLNGRLVEKNVEKSIELLELALRNPELENNHDIHISTLYHLATIYDNSYEQYANYPKKNIAKAIELYKKISTMDDSKAQSALLNIGYFYKTGNGVEKNVETSAKYFLMSIKKAQELQSKDIWTCQATFGRACLELESLGTHTIVGGSKEFWSRFKP